MLTPTIKRKKKKPIRKYCKRSKVNPRLITSLENMALVFSIGLFTLFMI